MRCERARLDGDRGKRGYHRRDRFAIEDENFDEMFVFFSGVDN